MGLFGNSNKPKKQLKEVDFETGTITTVDQINYEIMQSTGLVDKNGKEISVDNCKDEYIIPYIDALKRISPKKVMIYTLDREWPTEGLIKASKETMDSIAEKIRNAGFETSVSY